MMQKSGQLGEIIKQLDTIYGAHNGKIKELYDRETVPELNKLELEEHNEYS